MNADKPQLPDAARPMRRTPVYTALHQTTNGIEALCNFTTCKGRIQEATKALFTVIETAKQALLRLTDAPDIISQADLEYFEMLSADWMQRSLAEKMAVHRAPDYNALLRIHERFDAGCLVEPGRFFSGYDRTGIFIIGDSQFERPRLSRTPLGPRTRPIAPAMAVATPTPAQLQAWFDLPSDPPRAEASPAGS